MTSTSPRHSGNGSLTASGVKDRLYDEALLGLGARTTSLREWIGLLWSGKWVILATVGLAILGTGLYLYTVPPTYRTSTLLFVTREEDRVSSQLGGQSPLLREEGTLANELFLLRNSDVIAQRVAKRMQELGRHPRTGEPLPALVGPNGDSLSTAVVAGRIRAKMNAYRASEEVDGMRIVVTNSNPAQASVIANLYAEAYITRTKERSRESMKASRQFLERQADKLEDDVQAIEGRIEDYMQAHEAVSLDQASSTVVSRITELESRRSELQIELNMKRAALNNLEKELADAEPQLAERLSSNVNEQLEQVQKEKAELEHQISLIKRRNPGLNGGGTRARELQRMRREVARLQRRADSLARSYVDQALAAGTGTDKEGRGAIGTVAQKQQRAAQLRIEINGLEAQISVLDRQLTEEQSKLQSIPEQSMRLAQLQRERRSTEQIYSFVREKLQEIRLSEESEVGFAEVVRPAHISRVPIGPDVAQNLVLAFLFGIGLGSVIVVLWAKLDTHVHHPDDLKSKGYTIAGVIPPMDDLVQSQFEGKDRLEIDGRTVATDLVLLSTPMSAPAEAYRHVRTNLQFAQPDRTVQSIVVTSAEQGEGKTTTIANLALAFASAGKETVLVDGDLRHPRLHALFGGNQSPGLSTLLYDRTIDYDMFSVGVDHLKVIPAGDSVPNPAELLGSQRMEDLLSDLNDLYDIVLVDTPPVLLFSDGLALSSHVDGTLLIAGAGTSDGRMVDHAAEQINDVGGDLLGCVLNRYSGDASLYGYGSNYGYAQGQQRLSEYYRIEGGAR